MTFTEHGLLRGQSMRPQDPEGVEECVETLCNNGCRKVYDYIEALEKGEIFPEVAHLSEHARAVVLGQLISIMAVYDGGTCGS